jgi:ATP-binding protein involved in chromosome partitioning
MLFKAFEQFFRDVQWGELDYLIIDLPPGTGDVPLTIAQKVPVAGAVIVSTPQNLALVDAKKAIDMMDQIKIPILGVVENMAFMQMPGSDEKIQLFPRGDLNQYLDAKSITKLGEIPFDTKVGVTTEAGMPIVMSEPQSKTAKIFQEIAKKLTEKCEV